MSGLLLGKDAAEGIVRELGPLLQHSSRQASATAIELLSVFYPKHGKPTICNCWQALIVGRHAGTGNDHYSLRRPLVENLVPDLISLALAPLENLNQSTHATVISLLTVAVEDSEALEQVAPFILRFMPLLRKEALRPSILELLSLTSTSRKGASILSNPSYIMFLYAVDAEC